MSSRDVLFQPCEVLIPAAIENQITEKNAASVQAKILCEGANGPTTWQADAILDAKGVFTVPDILGNAGGVTSATSNGCKTGKGSSGARVKSTNA